jgi:tRNA-dihydrouridine synthase
MFSLGKLQLRSNLFLSPLAGYTNLPFRLVIREIGGVDLCTTDLVNARSLIEQNPKALKLIESNQQDSPPLRPAIRRSKRGDAGCIDYFAGTWR